MKNPDRLYNLLPAVYRQRDADQGYQLQALLRVVTEQVETVESKHRAALRKLVHRNVRRMGGAVIGDLVGYRCSTTAANPPR